MNKVLAFVFVILVASGCNRQDNTDYAMESDNEITTAADTLGISLFKQFHEKFSKDSSFQMESINYPITYLKYNDVGKTDTILINEGAWLYVNILPDKTGEQLYNIRYNKVGDDYYALQEGIETKVVIVYHFNKQGEEWKLYKVENNTIQ